MSANRFDTLALHAGAAPDPTTGARATPIYQTTSFSFRDTDHAAALFNMERAGHVYSRISNPTVAVFEERVAALENGAGAIGTASGQAALHLAIATLMGAGSHIVASSALYGGSHNLLHYTLRRFGIETTFVEPRDLDAWRAALRPEHAAAVRRDARQSGPRRARHRRRRRRSRMSTACRCWSIRPSPRLICCDRSNTARTSSITRPPSSSAATARRSAACWWTAARSTSTPSGRFPEFTEPYDGFHGMVFTEESTVAPFLLRARREGLRDFGACLHPQAAWQLLQGIETLPLRMDRHVANTRRWSSSCSRMPAVESVAYPELPTHPRPRARQAPAAARRRRGVQLQSARRPRRRHAASSKRSRCSRISRTSATRARW